MNDRAPDRMSSRTAPPYGPPPPGQEEDISLLQILTVFLKHRWWILGCVVVVAFFVGVTALQAPRTYSASASFLTQGSEGSRIGGAAALAGQFGISLPTGESGRSPAFYAELLRTREILSRVLADTFPVSETDGADTDRNSATLLELLGLDSDSEPMQRERGVRWLRNAVSTTTNQGTGLVEVEVTTRWPEVSRRISERLLELLNEFNLQQRQSEAIAERRFIEERLAEARVELLEAEGDLKRFLESNREFRNSPELVFEHDRLQRQVAMRQEIFTSLSQSYEEARISEVRNIPVITVVERPDVPPQGDPRGLLFRLVLGIVLGGVFGLFVAMTREMMLRRRAEGDEDYQEFHDVWEEAVDEVRRPLRRLAGKGADVSGEGS